MKDQQWDDIHKAALAMQERGKQADMGRDEGGTGEESGDDSDDDDELFDPLYDEIAGPSSSMTIVEHE